MFKSIFRHSSFFFLNLFRQSNDKDSFDSICTLLRYELEKEKFFETCQRTSDFCRVVFFVTPRLCGLFPNASVNETTQSVSRFHPCLYPTTYCACRSQAGVRGRHSYNYLRTENLYCSLCQRHDTFPEATMNSQVPYVTIQYIPRCKFRTLLQHIETLR